MDRNDLRYLSSDNTGDEEVLERARLWLSDCVSHHSSCEKHAQQDYCPPRLLYLDEDSVQLVETKGTNIEGRYATLSYCWGRNPRHLTLTTDNTDILRRGFKASHLAKTFREAIQVTQSLGIHLLWIDALCILQSGEGHVEDWQNHLVEMAVIYANCVLNIAVDHGESAEAGCYVSRDPDSVRPCIFEVSTITHGTTNASPEQEELRISDAYYLRDTSLFSDLLETPLVERGWVHQERLLSPRILHFGKTQLAWECTVLLACETSPVGLDYTLRDREIPFSFRGSTSDQWYKVIEAYSTSSLTNPQDKLAAIAGIAKCVSVERGAKYAAGSFLSDMPEALLWRFDGGPLGRIVTPYRAPSWSWASREGKVYFYRITDEANWGTFACIDDVVLEYIDENNPFGQLKSGLMRITAPMVLIAWTGGEDDTRMWVKNLKLVPRDSSDSLHDLPSFHGCFLFDESTLVRPRSGTSFLLISYDDTSLYGLILTPVEKSAQPQRWIRIGMFQLLPKTQDEFKRIADATSYLKAYPKTTIELV